VRVVRVWWEFEGVRVERERGICRSSDERVSGRR
jgi:hypothetical protein